MKTFYVFVSEPVDPQLVANSLQIGNFESGCNRLVIVDFTPLVGEGVSEDCRVISDSDAPEILLINCDSESAVTELINKIQVTDLIFYHILWLHYKKLEFVLKKINEKKLIYGIVANNSIPSLEKPFRNRLIEKVVEYNGFCLKVLSFFYKNIYKKNFNPSFVASAGEHNHKKFTALYGKNALCFNSYSNDYQKAIKLDRFVLDEFDKRNFILYIEQGDPFHPDNVIDGSNHSINPDQYYKGIENFLRMVEAKFGLEVVVSLPPKTLYFMPELLRYFDGRKKVINKTPELTKLAKLVLIQHSTAINFAVIFKKPVLFFSVRGVGKSFEKTMSMANIFHKKIFVIGKDEVIPEDDFMVKDYANLYAKYQSKWINFEGSRALSSMYHLVSKPVKK